MIGRSIDSRIVFAEEVLSVGGTSVGFTLATVANATGATVQVQVAPVRSQVQSDPTATVGKLWNVGDQFEVTGNDVRNIEFIAVGATASLFCEFWR